MTKITCNVSEIHYLQKESQEKQKLYIFCGSSLELFIYDWRIFDKNAYNCE